MKRIMFIAIIGCLLLFMLQGIWIYNTYKLHKREFLRETEKAFAISMGQEIWYRMNDRNYANSNNRVTYKYAKDMTSEEQARHKGDTLRISEKRGANRESGIGNTVSDVVMQMFQDKLFNDGKPVRLKLLDSIFMEMADTKAPYRIISLDADKQVTQTYSRDSLRGRVLQTKLFPVGTKNRQFLQMEIEYSMDEYLSAMVYVLAGSVLVMGIVVYIIFFQLYVIRKKDKLITIREISINGIIHDLKSPLASLLFLLAAIGDDEPDPERKEMIQKAQKRVGSLTFDIEQLLVVARCKSIKPQLEISENSPDKLYQAGTEKISVLLSSKPHTITLENSLGDGMIRGDRMLMENILKNLMENSLKYSGSGVEIAVRFYKKDNYTVMEVADNGIGIEKKYQKKLFSQFYRVPQKSKKAGGYGIGLTYVKYIVETHGGKIILNSELNKGTTISCLFPNK